MNWNIIRGKWKQLTGRAKQTWSRLSHDELTAVRGARDVLVGLIQEAYGVARAEAEKQVSAFAKSAGAALRDASRKAGAKGRVALDTAKRAGRSAAGGALGAAADRLERLRRSVDPAGTRKGLKSRAARKRSRSR
jgi:uncharacterized protein YjbJ (UPF0337 family)